MIVDLVQEYLKEINTNKKIRPYLRNYPFTLENLEFTIFILQPDGHLPPLEHIHCITAAKGIIEYELSVLPSDYAKDFPLLQQETLEEALEILKKESESSTSKQTNMFIQSDSLNLQDQQKQCV